MKRSVFLFLAVIVCAVSVVAQSTSLPPVDKSPIDICYYPANYPALKIQDKVTEPLAARVIYSRPKKEGRVIYGGLVEYGKVWRLGANEATEIEFYKAVTINGKKINKGRYTVYAIASQQNWTLILNTETDTWGAFRYDAKKDVVRMTVPVQTLTEPVEAMAMTFEKTSGGIQLIIAWDLVKVALPIQL